MKENNLGKIGLMTFAILILSVSFISSTGVSTPYWSTNPLKLGPGESTVISLGLQNMVGGEDVTLRAVITEGNEIATIVDEDQDYLVPFGTEDVTVNIEVKIPQNAEAGKVYDVQTSFTQIGSGDEGGFFQVASAFVQRIPVEVVSEKTESAIYGQDTGSNTMMWIILGIIALGVIFLAIQINRRRH